MLSLKRREPLSITVYEDYRAPDEFSYICAQVAEVEVDPETGAVKLHRIVTAHDVGTIINPLTHQGQIDGAAVMGVGQGLMEEIVIDQGKVTNNNLGDYKLPSIADLFELKTVFVSSAAASARTTPNPSASSPTTRRRRRSPTRSPTRLACGCLICR